MPTVVAEIIIDKPSVAIDPNVSSSGSKDVSSSANSLSPNVLTPLEEIRV